MTALLERIEASIPALPPAEQRVARLVLEDPRGFAQQPVAELAARSQVSKPTVVRFCRSVGYDGLVDFKRKLAGSVNEGVPFVHRAVDEDDKVGDIVVKVIDNAVSALLKYRNDAASHAFDAEALHAYLQAALGGQIAIGQGIRAVMGIVKYTLSPITCVADPNCAARPIRRSSAWRRKI